MDTAGPSKAKYTCDICSQTFDRAIRLANHQLKNLCGGISCKDCDKVFKQRSELQRHQKNSENIPCGEHCDRNFCTRYEYEKHKRQYKAVEVPSNVATREEIFPSLFDGVRGYEEIKRMYHSAIKDFVDKHNMYQIINKELPTHYTYGDLLKQLIEIKTGMTDVFRMNIAFGFTLFNSKDDEYKYFYPSTNNFLFETAYQISDNQDLEKYFHKVVGLDLVTNYYLKKPSSE